MLKLWKFRAKLGTVEWPDDLPGPNFWIPQSSLIWDLPKELKEYVRRVTDSGKRFYQKVKRKQAPMIFGDKDRTMKAYHERSGETMGTRWTGRKEATEYARAVEKTLYVTVERAWCRHCLFNPSSLIPLRSQLWLPSIGPGSAIESQQDQAGQDALGVTRIETREKEERAMPEHKVSEGESRVT